MFRYNPLYFAKNVSPGKTCVKSYSKVRNHGSLGKPCVCDWLILVLIHPKWHFGGWNIVFSSPVHPKLEFHGYRPVFLFSVFFITGTKRAGSGKIGNGKNIVRFLNRISFWEHSVKIRPIFLTVFRINVPAQCKIDLSANLCHDREIPDGETRGQSLKIVVYLIFLSSPLHFYVLS